MRVVGVDACRSGWVGVTLDDGRVAGTQVAADLTDIVRGCRDAVVIGVDMPLGLVKAGWRRAGALAKLRLGAVRSRVFMVPPRAAWDAASHAEAVAICRQRTDPPAGFSIQAWQLKPKLRQAGRLREQMPGLLYEVHPEISFAELNGGPPIMAGKKTWNGQLTRRALLAAASVHLPDDLPGAGAVPPDDILDAAAAAWSAARIARGHGCSLPDPPQPDHAGQPTAIWY
ncbi:MAG: DUF429 domain-containing protein [Streptosporangiaceae bacterium]|jgi:predicted RNase H-like nuclease